jgi:hypothetical protein
MQPGIGQALAITPGRLRAAAQQLEELRRSAERVAFDPQRSAMEWRATCAPLLIRLPEARQLLVSLAPIRVGYWPDTRWAARVRSACSNVERRLQDVALAMSILTGDETSNPDAAGSLMSDAPLLAAAASDLQRLLPGGFHASSSTQTCQPGESDRDGFRSPGNGGSDAHEVAEALARQMTTLTDILGLVGYEAQLMDASLGDTHEIASRAGRLVTDGIFGSGGPLSISSHPDAYGKFERALADEGDIYELYADDLERHQKRRRKDLTVADSDADKATVTKRRRMYIATLFDYCACTSEITGRRALARSG